MPNPVQEGNLIFTDPPRHRQLRKLINSGFTRRRVSVLEPKIREIVRGILDGLQPNSVARVRRGDRRSPAHPDDRRADRRPARRLGAVPGVVGRGHRHRRPGDRTRPDGRDGAALRVLPETDRGPAHRRARRPAVGAGRRGDRRASAHRRGPAQLRVPAAGRRQRDHPQSHRAGHAGADRPSRPMPPAGRGSRSDPGRRRGDAALEQPGGAHGAHRD